MDSISPSLPFFMVCDRAGDVISFMTPLSVSCSSLLHHALLHPQGWILTDGTAGVSLVTTTPCFHRFQLIKGEMGQTMI